MLREALLYLLVWVGFGSVLWCYRRYQEWRYGEEADRADREALERGVGAPQPVLRAVAGSTEKKRARRLSCRSTM